MIKLAHISKWINQGNIRNFILKDINLNIAEGEFVSTPTYPQADDRKVPHQFLPGAWEP